MASFMNKVKAPKPPKPMAAKPLAPKPLAPKPIKSDVQNEEKQKIAENEIPKVENSPVEEIVAEIPAAEPVIVEEPVEEVVEVVEEEPTPDPEEDDKIEDQAIEEIIEDANTEPEPVAEEPASEPEPVEEEKPKAKKKSSRKKKAEPKTEESKQPAGEPVGIEAAEELIMDIVMPCSEDWAAEKERVNGMLDKIVITEELDPTSIKALLADMSSALRELIMLAQESKTSHSNLKDVIDGVKAENYTGSNSEERKLNATHALKNYVINDQVVDLMSLLRFYREREDFYEAAVKQIEINRQMLITFGSVFKIELAKAY